MTLYLPCTSLVVATRVVTQIESTCARVCSTEMRGSVASLFRRRHSSPAVPGLMVNERVAVGGCGRSLSGSSLDETGRRMALESRVYSLS